MRPLVALDDTCVLALDLEDNFGATYLDASEYGNHMTRVGAAQCNGISGLGLEFDGTGDYLTIATPAASLNDLEYITASLWAKSNEAGGVLGANRRLLDRDMSNVLTWGLWAAQATDKITARIRLGVGGGTALTIVADDVLDTDWHHYAFTYDGDNFYLYVDGVRQTDTSGTDGSLDRTNPGVLAVGATSALDVCWNGIIDEVRIWSRALSAEEVRDLYTEFGPV